MATAYLSPGVYVEEVDRGSKPIEGVGTAVAAFVGFAETGPVGDPTLITNVTLGRGRNARNVVDVVNRESKFVRVAEREATGTLHERAPAVGSYPLARVEPQALASPAVSLPAISSKEFIGEAADRTGVL